MAMESVVRGNKSIGASISIQYSTVKCSAEGLKGAIRRTYCTYNPPINDRSHTA